MEATLYEAAVAPHAAAILGESSAQAVALFRSPELPRGIEYALLPALEPGVKPFAYPSLEALARRIHRDRQGEALQLKAVKVRFRDCTRPVVEVLAVNEAGERTRRIGFAWLAGSRMRREALEAALLELVPPGVRP